MLDLIALAFAAETTRVATLKLGRDTSNRVFPESGSMTPFHSASHHQDVPATIIDLAKINRYHVGLLAYFLDKLQNTPDGDGNLLDHSLVFLRQRHGAIPTFMATSACRRSWRSRVGRHQRQPARPSAKKKRRRPTFC